MSQQESGQRPVQAPNRLNYDNFINNSTKKQSGTVRQSSTTRETHQKESIHKAKDPQATQVQFSLLFCFHEVNFFAYT